MADKKEINYFSIGLFFLIGVAFIVAAIIVFGSKTLFKDYVYAETYFNESVQGLTKGSPVKYRGMDIGNVVDIASVDSIYHNRYNQGANKEPSGLSLSTYIYVKMSIPRRFFDHAFGYSLEKNLQQAIDHGFRMKLSVQGLTGTAYLEADFVDPKTTPVLPIYWQPEDYYIPSAPSTLAYFSENAQYLVRELRKIDFPKVVNSVEDAMRASSQAMVSANQTLGNANNILINNNHQINEITKNMQTVSENLKSISDRMKQHPSSVLFSKPPTKLDPKKL